MVQSMSSKRRLRSSWGAVEEREPGVWRIRYRADLGDGRGYTRHSETLKGTRMQAERRLAKLRVRYDEGLRSQVPTFDDLWERDVLPSVMALAPNTRKTYLSHWKLVSERWGSTALDAYNGAEVQDWLQTVPRRTGQSCLMLMRKVSNRALLLGVVQRDPLAADIKVSSVSKRPPERTELKLGPYFEAALEASPMLFAGVVLMAAGGCRFGEALGVRADSVRWVEEEGRAVFEVADQVVEARPELAGRLKNRQSLRTASVPGWLGRELYGLAQRAISEGCTFVVDSGFGEPISEAAFRSRLRRVFDRAGLPHVTMRSLRRSFATVSLDAGADPGELNLAMGHTRDSRVLYTNYDRPDSSRAPIVPAAWDHLGPKDGKGQAD